MDDLLHIDVVSYCDETGHDHFCYVMAGYIGSAEQWRAFDRKWKDAGILPTSFTETFATTTQVE